MSLSLDLGTKPNGLLAYFGADPTVLFLGDCAITMRDFVLLVEYVMTNTDLMPDDPRLRLIRRMISMCVVAGYNPGSSRLVVNVDHVSLLQDLK